MALSTFTILRHESVVDIIKIIRAFRLEAPKQTAEAKCYVIPMEECRVGNRGGICGEEKEVHDDITSCNIHWRVGLVRCLVQPSPVV